MLKYHCRHWRRLSEKPMKTLKSSWTWNILAKPDRSVIKCWKEFLQLTCFSISRKCIIKETASHWLFKMVVRFLFFFSFIEHLFVWISYLLCKSSRLHLLWIRKKSLGLICSSIFTRRLIRSKKLFTVLLL